MNMPENKRTEKTYDLGRKVRGAQEKDEFVPYLEPVLGSKHNNRFLSVKKNGETKLTLAGYYHEHMLEIQNARKLEEATCRRYDNIVCTLIAPAFAKNALDEMDEFDFLACWDKILNATPRQSDLQTAYSLVRLIADYAYQHGGTEVTLWGLMPEDQASFGKKKGSTPAQGKEEKDDEEREGAEENEERREAKRFADKGIRIARTMSLVTEFKLFMEMLQNLAVFGQVLAGLIIFTIGVRTSEAIAFQFKHFCEVTPGYWGLQRINVSAPEARESVAGGKSHNAIRLLWVPKFLAKIILERREYLLTLYPQEVVDNLTIACYGTDYQRPCTQKELNAHMKELFRKVGVKEDMIASAFETMRESDETMEEYERSIVAYLGRHQAITAMVYCGLTEAEICVCAGHEQIDKDVKPYDLVNPDAFRALADKLSRRPIVQIFDQMQNGCTVIFDGGTKPFASDGWLRIEIQTDEEKEFFLYANSIEANTPLEIGEVNNVQIIRNLELTLPKRKEDRTVSIRHDLCREGQNAYRAAKDEIEKSALEAACAADDLEWLDQAEGFDVQVYAPQAQEVSPLPDVQSLLPAVRIPESARTRADQPAEASESSGELPADQHLEDHLPETAADQYLPGTEDEKEYAAEETKPERAIPPIRYADSSEHLYVLDGQGKLTRISHEQCRLYNRGSRGRKVLKDKQDAVALYTYRPDMPAFLISKQGWIYRVLAGELFCEDPSSEKTAYTDVLREHGILLQDPNMMKAGASLICLAKGGDVIRLSLNKFSGSFPVAGKPLIHPEAAKNHEIISACICPAENDILLITQNGQALRIANKELKINRSFGLQPIKGIHLDEGDRAVACVPYTDDGILCITADGCGMMYQGKTAIRPHGRGTMGMAFVKLREGDKVMNVMIPGQAVAILREDGYLCCLEISQFPPREKNSIGVTAMATDRGKYVVAAGPLGAASNPV